MLRLGESISDTQMRVAEVCELLISHNTLPIILSNNHAIEFGQFLAYRDLEKLISIASIDAKIDLLDETHSASEYHLHQIFSHHPNFLFDYAHLGYQRYLNQPTILETLRMLNFEARSVGEMRQNFSDIEPIVRMADMLGFDLSAVKRSDISAQKFLVSIWFDWRGSLSGLLVCGNERETDFFRNLRICWRVRQSKPIGFGSCHHALVFHRRILPPKGGIQLQKQFPHSLPCTFEGFGNHFGFLQKQNLR